MYLDSRQYEMIINDGLGQPIANWGKGCGGQVEGRRSVSKVSGKRYDRRVGEFLVGDWVTLLRLLKVGRAAIVQ